VTPEKIIHRIRPRTGLYPTEAVKAAIEQRESVSPLLLQALEEAAAAPEAAFDAVEDQLLIFAMFLLAQFRETRALEPLCRLLSYEAENVDSYMGDASTGGLNRVFASLYSGNLGPLQALIETPNACEWVRSAALQGMAILVELDRLDRGVVEDYFHSLLTRFLEREPSYVWETLAVLSSRLRFPSLVPALRQAAEEELIPDCDIYEDLDDLLKGKPSAYSGTNILVSNLIEDTIDEMTYWYSLPPVPDWEEILDGIDPERLSDSPKMDLDLPGKIWSSLASTGVPPSKEPLAFEPSDAPSFGGQEKIGRNEDCPCGSGRKYKKCCGA
jgi:hypothetical protein